MTTGIAQLMEVRGPNPERAAEVCKVRFDLEQNAAAFAKLYRELLDRRH